MRPRSFEERKSYDPSAFCSWIQPYVSTATNHIRVSQKTGTREQEIGEQKTMAKPLMNGWHGRCSLRRQLHILVLGESTQITFPPTLKSALILFFRHEDPGSFVSSKIHARNPSMEMGMGGTLPAVFSTWTLLMPCRYKNANSNRMIS